MKSIKEIINAYTHGECGLEDTNGALKEIGAGVYLDPERNLFSAEELLNTCVGETPAQANGWGLLDHGVGCMEKVHVENGKTVDVDMGEEVAFVYISGKTYRLKGNALCEM